MSQINNPSGAMTIGDSILSGMANRVLYEDSSNQLAESDNLQFDGNQFYANSIKFGTIIEGPAGIAGEPSYTFTDHYGVGMYRYGQDGLGFSVGSSGIERLTIDDNGAFVLTCNVTTGFTLTNTVGNIAAIIGAGSYGVTLADSDIGFAGDFSNGSQKARFATVGGYAGDFTGPVRISTPLLPDSGGTGISSYAVGDLLYASASTTLSKLADVATGNALISGGVTTAPSWGKIGLTTHITGTLAEGNGGTNQSTYAQGDLLYASASNTLAKLAKNTSSTRYLSNTGTSNNPAWAQVDLTNGVTGALPVANGGTGDTTGGGMVPVGGTIGWLKSLTGTPALAANYVECNGQTLSDSGSVYNGGTIPNLNASGGGTKRFLRGSTTSGTTGGADTYTPAGTLGTASASVGLSTAGATQVATAAHTHTFTGSNAGYLPSYYEVVWVMRVK